MMVARFFCWLFSYGTCFVTLIVFSVCFGQMIGFYWLCYSKSIYFYLFVHKFLH